MTWVPPPSHELRLWQKSESERVMSRLRARGYVRTYETLHVVRDVEPMSVAGAVELVPRERWGDARFVEQFARALVRTPNRYAQPDDPEGTLARLAAQLGEALDVKLWSVAVLDGEAIGVVMPQRFPRAPEIGTLSFVGLAPPARGRGLAASLHAAALALLARAGVRRYKDMTDVENVAMVRVFFRNGCCPVGIQHHYHLRPRTEERCDVQ